MDGVRAPVKRRTHVRSDLANDVLGQSRRFRDVRRMSGLPQIADISGPGRHFAFGPQADIADASIQGLGTIFTALSRSGSARRNRTFSRRRRNLTADRWIGVVLGVLLDALGKLRAAQQFDQL
jgi:hypothetical protein